MKSTQLTTQGAKLFTVKKIKNDGGCINTFEKGKQCKRDMRKKTFTRVFNTVCFSLNNQEKHTGLKNLEKWFIFLDKNESATQYI